MDGISKLSCAVLRMLVLVGTDGGYEAQARSIMREDADATEVTPFGTEKELPHGRLHDRRNGLHLKPWTLRVLCSLL